LGSELEQAAPLVERMKAYWFDNKPVRNPTPLLWHSPLKTRSG
jgi:hypothetical protein